MWLKKVILEKLDMSRVANRMVWANGFTNDKRHCSNKEPYQKTCKKCDQSIWLNPTNNGWKALSADGKPHSCVIKKAVPKKKKKEAQRSKPKAYSSKCKYCNEPIVMTLLNKKWTPIQPEGVVNQRHRCKKKQKEV